MKVLWVINNPVQDISDKIGINVKDSIGWISGYLEGIIESDIDLSICFPLSRKEILVQDFKGVKYLSFYKTKLIFRKFSSATRTTKRTRSHINQILNIIKPDILHIFGSEYKHSLDFAQLFNRPDRTILHIQGLISEISKHYFAGLSCKVLRKRVFSNIFRGSIKKQKVLFIRRGINEIKLINSIKYVNGRTQWDKAVVEQINLNLQYFHCNESLRSCFYFDSWSINSCNKHQIFMSQATYPLKGLHFALEAMVKIKDKYPGVKLVIAGNNLIDESSIYAKLKKSSYAYYISKLIQIYDLTESIVFTGFLTDIQLKQELVSSHVYICPSALENSPNSLGEAMILGVPSVASHVGGIPDMLKDKEEGFLYQHDAPFILSQYICEIFENEDLAVRFSKKARQQALKTHDVTTNTNRLIEIYDTVMNERAK